MLLNSVNPIDYVLDITSNKENADDKNTYKNLRQEEEEENSNDSNALNFNESENDSNNSNNYIRNRKEYDLEKKSKIMNFLIDKVFLNLTKCLKVIGPLFCITIITFLLYTYASMLKYIFPYWYKYFFPYEKHKIFYNVLKILKK